MDINQFVAIILESVKDDEIRADIYTRILEDSEEYDMEDVETGIDPIFDEIYSDYAPIDEDDVVEEDEDWEESSSEEK
jgi:hypothetical protein